MDATTGRLDEEGLGRPASEKCAETGYDAVLGALLLAARGGDARNRARSAAPHGCQQRRSGAQRAAGTRAQRKALTAGFLPFPRAGCAIFRRAASPGTQHRSHTAAPRTLRLHQLVPYLVGRRSRRADRRPPPPNRRRRANTEICLHGRPTWVEQRGKLRSRLVCWVTRGPSGSSRWL